MGKSKKGLWLVVILVVLLLSGAVAAYFAGALQPIIDMLSGEENATGAMIESVKPFGSSKAKRPSMSSGGAVAPPAI